MPGERLLRGRRTFSQGILLAMANRRTFHASSRRLAVTTETCWATNLPERAPTTFQRRGGCTTITLAANNPRRWFASIEQTNPNSFVAIGQFFTVGSKRRREEGLFFAKGGKTTLSLSLSLCLSSMERQISRSFRENFAFLILLGNRVCSRFCLRILPGTVGG